MLGVGAHPFLGRRRKVYKLNTLRLSMTFTAAWDKKRYVTVLDGYLLDMATIQSAWPKKPKIVRSLQPARYESREEGTMLTVMAIARRLLLWRRTRVGETIPLNAWTIYPPDSDSARLAHHWKGAPDSQAAADDYRVFLFSSPRSCEYRRGMALDMALQYRNIWDVAMAKVYKENRCLIRSHDGGDRRAQKANEKRIKPFLEEILAAHEETPENITALIRTQGHPVTSASLA